LGGAGAGGSRSGDLSLMVAVGLMKMSAVGIDLKERYFLSYDLSGEPKNSHDANLDEVVV
jgi:hypothetical protein